LPAVRRALLFTKRFGLQQSIVFGHRLPLLRHRLNTSTGTHVSFNIRFIN